MWTQGSTRGFFNVFFCFFFREKKPVSGLVQVWSGWDLWLKRTAKDYSSFFFVVSPLQRTWAVLVPHGCITPEGHLQLSPPPMLAPGGLGVAQGTSGVSWGSCAAVLVPVHRCRGRVHPSHWGVLLAFAAESRSCCELCRAQSWVH